MITNCGKCHKKKKIGDKLHSDLCFELLPFYAYIPKCEISCTHP